MYSGCALSIERQTRMFNLEEAAAAAARGGGRGPAQYQNDGKGAVALAPTQEGTMYA